MYRLENKSSLIISSFVTFFVTIAFFPAFASAQADRVTDSVDDFANEIIKLLDTLISLLFVLAIFWLMWKLFSYVRNPDGSDSKKKTELLWAFALVFVMFAFWGILLVIGDAIGIDPEGSDPISRPTINIR